MRADDPWVPTHQIPPELQQSSGSIRSVRHKPGLYVREIGGADVVSTSHRELPRFFRDLDAAPAAITPVREVGLVEFDLV
jgi:hypothetical protein